MAKAFKGRRYSLRPMASIIQNQTVREAITAAQLETILGQAGVKHQLKGAILSGRNVIIVGPPGVGKTTMARSIAAALEAGKEENCPFVRVQGSPDLTAEDLIGDIDPIKALEFGPMSKEAFTPGKIFKADKGILFFDEVNRCSEKLQNALLQALEEKLVTIGSYDVDLPADFLFIGTMNPEDTSTEKMSDVFLDRFDLIEMSYPENEEIENTIIETHGQTLAEISPKLKKGIVDFIFRLRRDERLEKKPSVRATLGLFDRAQTHALLDGRKHVQYKDVQAVVVSVLAHRIGLKPSVKYLQSPEDYVRKEFNSFARETDLAGDDP